MNKHFYKLIKVESNRNATPSDGNPSWWSWDTTSKTNYRNNLIQQAIDLGGNLVTINDDAELNFLRTEFGGTNNTWLQSYAYNDIGELSRFLIDNRSVKKKVVSFSTKITKDLFKNLKIRFLNKRKIAYAISFVLILTSIFSLTTNGLNQGVDFVGGRSYTVRFDKIVNPTEVKNILDNTFGSTEVKTFGEENQLKITTKYKVDIESTEVDREITSKLFNSLNSLLPENITYENFVNGSDVKNVGIMSSIKVGPTIADDIKKNSVLAVFGSLIVVFLYILIRFRKWQFSLGAVAAVFHDVLIVLGIFSITYKFMPFNMEINQAFIAAILTVIGYSLNDTVVVFDRIREYINEYKSWKFIDKVNSALNSTLSRTLNTSLTTLIVLLAIFTFGGESIRGFMFALIVGVLVGTYSSVFIATPIMFDTQSKKSKTNS